MSRRGVGEESADLAEGDGPRLFEAASAADESRFALVVAEQCFLAEMDMQHQLRPQLAGINLLGWMINP